MTVVIVVLARSSVPTIPSSPLATGAGAALGLRPRPTIVLCAVVGSARVAVVVPLATTIALLLCPTREVVAVIIVAARVRACIPGEPTMASRTRPPCAIVAVAVATASRIVRVPLTAAASSALRLSLPWAIVGVIIVSIAHVGLVVPMATALTTVRRPPIEIVVVCVSAIAILGIPSQAATALLLCPPRAIRRRDGVAIAVRDTRVARIPSASTITLS